METIIYQDLTLFVRNPEGELISSAERRFYIELRDSEDHTEGKTYCRLVPGIEDPYVIIDIIVEFPVPRTKELFGFIAIAIKDLYALSCPLIIADPEKLKIVTADGELDAKKTAARFSEIQQELGPDEILALREGIL